MNVSRLKLSNILGIEELDLNMGKYTEISGKNGSGKTSILEGLKSVLKGGNDATLLRNGETKGEIVIILDDGTQIFKTITQKTNKVEIYDKNGAKFAKPQSVISELADLLSVNPITFLTSAKKDRTKALLEVLPLELPMGKLNDAMRNSNLILPNIEGHPLEVIQEFRDTVYSERTGVNRLLKEKEGTLSQLQESLVEVDFDADALTARINEIEDKRIEMAAKREQFMARVTELKETELEAARINFENLKTEILNKFASKTADIVDNYNEKYEPLNEELIQLRTRLETAGGVKKTKELIKQYTAEKTELSDSSLSLSDIIEKLDAIKLGMLKNLPIQGLEVIDGEIYLDSIPFDRLNTAKQVQIAVEVAKLRAGELKLICVDGLEKLDSEAYATFKEESIKSGLQLLVTKVTDTELLINNEN